MNRRRFCCVSHFSHQSFVIYYKFVSSYHFNKYSNVFEFNRLKLRFCLDNNFFSLPCCLDLLFSMKIFIYTTLPCFKWIMKIACFIWWDLYLNLIKSREIILGVINQLIDVLILFNYSYVTDKVKNNWIISRSTYKWKITVQMQLIFAICHLPFKLVWILIRSAWKNSNSVN